MLPTAEIIQRLKDLDDSFQKETDVIKALLFAKLATLEVGGWTEECIDKIVTDFVNEKNPKSKNKILEQLGKFYGFQYGGEFRSIVVVLIGTIVFDKIESKIDIECQRLQSALAELKKSRDVCAHTYTKAASAIDAPSKMIDLLGKIAAGLHAFNNELKAVAI